MQDTNDDGVEAARHEDERQQGFGGEGSEQNNQDLPVASAFPLLN
jgi:hypothetical protein